MAGLRQLSAEVPGFHTTFAAFFAARSEANCRAGEARRTEVACYRKRYLHNSGVSA